MPSVLELMSQQLYLPTHVLRDKKYRDMNRRNWVTWYPKKVCHHQLLTGLLGYNIGTISVKVT